MNTLTEDMVHEPAVPAPHCYPHLAGKRGYKIYHVTADLRLMEFIPPATSDDGFMNAEFAIGCSRLMVEQRGAVRAYILRNTFGPKGYISGGHVVLWTPAMRTAEDIEAAPHCSNFLINP